MRVVRAVTFLALTVATSALAATFPSGCADDATSPLADASPPLEATTPDTGVPVVPKGSRVLGLALDVGDVAFEKNVQLARDAGARATNVAFGWDEIEQPYDAGAAADAGDDGGASDAATPTQLFDPLLHIANLILSTDGMQALLALDALDVGGSRAPAELADRPFDDGELIARYERLTDYALRSVPDLTLVALFVGSSVDVALGDDAQAHAKFATFVQTVAAHARAAHPGLKVGFSVTADGATLRRERLAAAWAASDVIGITLLPMDAQGRARADVDLTAALDRLVAAAPTDKPILLQQVGYPTSPDCGGDEAAQASFVGAAFKGWDRHADRIPLLLFRELDDTTVGVAALEAARYRRNDPAILGFLGSLGVRGRAGRTKPALDRLVGESRARGF